jgi:hypothetical protein
MGSGICNGTQSKGDGMTTPKVDLDAIIEAAEKAFAEIEREQERKRFDAFSEYCNRTQLSLGTVFHPSGKPITLLGYRGYMALPMVPTV